MLSLQLLDILRLVSSSFTAGSFPQERRRTGFDEFLRLVVSSSSLVLSAWLRFPVVPRVRSVLDVFLRSAWRGGGIA